MSRQIGTPTETRLPTCVIELTNQSRLPKVAQKLLLYSRQRSGLMTSQVMANDNYLRGRVS